MCITSRAVARTRLGGVLPRLLILEPHLEINFPQQYVCRKMAITVRPHLNFVKHGLNNASGYTALIMSEQLNDQVVNIIMSKLLL